MKKITFLIITFLMLVSVSCGHTSDRSAPSGNSQTQGPVLNNIPSGKYELFSILNAVYEANPDLFDNQVKMKEFLDMLSATLNSRAKRNPDLYTEFPVNFYTRSSVEQQDGSFVVSFDYQLFRRDDYPEMDNYWYIDYSIYTKMSRESYSKMKNGRYIIKGKYMGLLENSKLKDMSLLRGSLINGMDNNNKLELHAYIGNLYYEDVSVELIEEL